MAAKEITLWAIPALLLALCGGCNSAVSPDDPDGSEPQPASVHDSPQALFSAFFDALNRMDISLMDDLLDEDFVYMFSELDLSHLGYSNGFLYPRDKVMCSFSNLLGGGEGPSGHVATAFQIYDSHPSGQYEVPISVGPFSGLTRFDMAIGGVIEYETESGTNGTWRVGQGGHHVYLRYHDCPAESGGGWFFAGMIGTAAATAPAKRPSEDVSFGLLLYYFCIS